MLLWADECVQSTSAQIGGQAFMYVYIRIFLAGRALAVEKALSTRAEMSPGGGEGHAGAPCCTVSFKALNCFSLSPRVDCTSAEDHMTQQGSLQMRLVQCDSMFSATPLDSRRTHGNLV